MIHRLKPWSCKVSLLLYSCNIKDIKSTTPLIRLYLSFQEEDIELTKVELLRLALARNLAMAIVKEGTVEAWIKALLHFCTVYKIQVIKMCSLIIKTLSWYTFFSNLLYELSWHPLKEIFISSCSKQMAHHTVCTDLTLSQNLHITCSHHLSYNKQLGTLHTMYI